MDSTKIAVRHLYVRNMNRKIIKSTPFGSVGVIWTGLNDNPKIVRILLSKSGLSAEDQVSEFYPNSQAFSCAEIDNVATAIKGLLEGEEIESLLEKEGIPFDDAGRVACAQFHYQRIMSNKSIQPTPDL